MLVNPLIDYFFIKAIQNHQIVIMASRWDPTACSNGLTLIEPERLVVQFTGEGRPGCVFAERPIPKTGIFYFEVNIINQQHPGGTAIGLATKPTSPALGLSPLTSDGTFSHIWGFGAGGQWHCWRAELNPSFGAGDVIGCGVNWATRRIIYTRNGERLGTKIDLFVPDSDDDVFPLGLLSKLGDKIEANFGPNFKFDTSMCDFMPFLRDI